MSYGKGAKSCCLVLDPGVLPLIFFNRPVPEMLVGRSSVRHSQLPCQVRLGQLYLSRT